SQPDTPHFAYSRQAILHCHAAQPHSGCRSATKPSPAHPGHPFFSSQALPVKSQGKGDSMHSTIDTRMLNIAQEAALYGIGTMSLGEALTAALILNRCDWLRELGYSIAEALDRIGPEWTARLREVERQFYDEVTQTRRRFNFEILPHPADTGCFMLRLLEGG